MCFLSAVRSMNQPCALILTSAGQLPSRNIIHIVGQNDPANIKDVVYSVLKICEENRFTSVAFPALGTGLCVQLTDSLCSRVLRSSLLREP